ncbi:MAG: peptidylprolyl isomerase [Chloroflexi bacterium]|nr:peptidylprolyl isomerase [Chloroflexota bacterium]
MPKESIEPEHKIITKKHMARMEKEHRQRNFLLIGIIVLLVIVVGLVIYGVLDNTLFKPGKTVAKINSTRITVEQFEKRVKYERYSLTNQFMNYAASQYAMFFQSQLVQVQNQLDDYLQFGSDTLDKMINEEAIAQKAKELGLTVSEEEIDKELQENFGYYANGTPTPVATEIYRPTSTFSPTQLAIITLTPTPTDLPTATLEPATATEVVTNTTQISGTVEPTKAPTATQVPPTSTPTVIPTSTEILPTPTEYTKSGYEGQYATMVSDASLATNFNDLDFRNYVRNILLSGKLYDYVTKDVLPEQEMVWARHILVNTEDEAKLVLTKLNQGEDWAALALQYSQDTSNNSTGGDLGWFSKGQMVTEFETAAFALKIGEISQPVKTSFGYHIIQALGHETRQLTSSELTTSKSSLYQKFVDDFKSGYSINKNDIWASVVPNTPSIPAEYRIAVTSTPTP